MNFNELIKNIDNGFFDGDFLKLYGETKEAKIRFKKTASGYSDSFNTKGEVFLFSAPGRTEVGGNHTDHQHGKVLAGSVNLDTIAVVCLNDENVVRIKSEGYPLDEIDLNDLAAKKEEEGHAASLCRGICSFFKERGYNVSGFNAYTTSNVLKGSGLSSSAAFEVLIGNIINDLFNDGKASAVEIAQISQKAENIYFGKPSGLLDQMASSVGGFTAIDFADPANPVVEKIDFDLAGNGYSLCIINTGGSHANLTDSYAEITRDMAEVSAVFGKKYLREISEEDFFNNIVEVKNKCSSRAIVRAIHFYNDNKNAELEKNALKNGDFSEFLNLITASGNSSFKYLQNVFATSAPEEQNLSLCICLAERYLKNKGAVRVHGGGFAGTIQCFVKNDMLNGFKEYIEKVFGEKSCYVLNIRQFGGYQLKG